MQNVRDARDRSVDDGALSDGALNHLEPRSALDQPAVTQGADHEPVVAGIAEQRVNERLSNLTSRSCNENAFHFRSSTAGVEFIAALANGAMSENLSRPMAAAIAPGIA
jgi:hypothetical protein